MYKPITNIADMAGKYFQYSIGDAVALKAVEQFTKVVRVFQYSIGDARIATHILPCLLNCNFQYSIGDACSGIPSVLALSCTLYFQYSIGDA